MKIDEKYQPIIGCCISLLVGIAVGFALVRILKMLGIL